MASLSLPRVLQLKKNSLDAEREHFEKFQTLAIQKAINSVETPVKEKHVRSTLIGTFQEQSAITYWMVALRLPLQDNRIAAWKFCHVTHKVLREGHPACLDDSQRHVPMIENLGRLWVHLREGYGKLIHLYSGLLATKLKFHARNPRFPGNMHITGTELDNIAENDVNNYFQLCVELFDYMDDLLNLQAAVFDSLGNARANSMTASGQCRLAALIPCAQDSSRIYDTNVRLLFRLHASLPPDTLAGHRERFRTQFRKLSQFYKHASSLQYYRNLLSLPVLPANPPNFLQQSDFGTYVAPVVSVPDQPPDEPDNVGSLIDTTDTISQATTPDWEVASSRAPTPPPDPLFERDRLIEHLQNELRRMRMDASQMSQERNVALGSLREHCSALEAKLQDAKYELEEEKQKTEVLIVQTPEIKQKLAATEEKAKVIDEKFQKLKGAYTQLREEHIALIRQKAEMDKAAAALRAASAAHDSARAALQQQLSDRNKDVELLQQSASSSEEIEAYKSELANLRTDLEQSRQKEVELETLRASMDALQIDYKTATTEQEQKIATIENELKEISESLEKTKHERDEKESELNKVKEELVCLRENSGNEYKKVVEQKDAALKQVAELTQQYQQEKEAQASSINSLQEEIGSLQEKHINTETSFANKCKELSDELEAKNQALDITLTQKDGEIKEALDKLAEVEVRLVEIENSKNSEINELHLKIEERLNEISSLQTQVDEKADLCEKFKNENTEIQNTVSELQIKLEENNTELQNLNSQLLEATSCLDQRNVEIEALRQNSEHSVIALKDKLQTVIDLKDENIKGLKEAIAKKDEQVISLNVEVSRLQLELNRLEEDLNEAQAELEIGKNEFVTLNEEHENFIQRNDSNLILKNQELRSLNDEVSKLSEEKTALIAEKEKLCSEFALEKQVLENKLKDVEDAHKEAVSQCEIIQNEKDDIIQKNNEEVKEFKAEYDQIVETKDIEVKTLHEKIADQETAFDTKLSEKDNTIVELEKSVEELKAQLEELQTSKQKEKEETGEILLRREKDSQILEARLSHSDTERLTAECELQDLLQHNAVLEADLAAARAQLNVARGDLEAQRVALVRSAGGAALRATESARAGLAAGPQDAAKAAADGAEGALGVLASKTELKDNEEAISGAALSAAHHAAALAAYVADVAAAVTEPDVADKLTAECRSLLSATHSCLEPISQGLPAPAAAAEEARAAARRAWRGAAAADKPLAVRSVDDELADMDRAIEDAATQIEELLAASRAGDTGVKLEVNGNILDACTTLMGAVKVLVRDARALQRELGDPKTRETVYRKNPQWSEGLISAAKAVVFAAKLLVSSADEAVGAGGGGRMEGVSAAAHEVAGSTAQLVAASRARAPPAATGLTKLTTASRAVAAATGALVAAVRAAAAKFNDQEALDTSSLTLTATRRLEMESKVRSLELEAALDAERARLAALRKRHYHLAQMQENGGMANGKE